MNLAHLVILSLGLSIDTALAAMAQGNFVRAKHIRESLKISFCFAFFHGAMPLLGWKLASYLGNTFRQTDHWLIFLLFSYLGVKLIWDSLQKNKEKIHLTFAKMIILSLAISVDALLVGASLSFMKWEIITPVICISFVTFVSSMCGFWLGNRFKKMELKGIEIFSGLLLIFLGLKVLYEHLCMI